MCAYYYSGFYFFFSHCSLCLYTRMYARRALAQRAPRPNGLWSNATCVRATSRRETVCLTTTGSSDIFSLARYSFAICPKDSAASVVYQVSSDVHACFETAFCYKMLWVKRSLPWIIRRWRRRRTNRRRHGKWKCCRSCRKEWVGPVYIQFTRSPPLTVPTSTIPRKTHVIFAVNSKKTVDLQVGVYPNYSYEYLIRFIRKQVLFDFHTVCVQHEATKNYNFH